MPKIKLQLVHKVNLLPTAVSMIFKCEDEFKYTAGQFLSILVAEKTYRSYSLFYCDSKAPKYYDNDLEDLETGKYIGLMINTKPMGPGSQKAIDMQIGEFIDAIGCNGQFVLVENDRPKVFVASSTGLAPFVPIIEQALAINPDQKIKIFFGAFVPSDDFTAPFFTNYPQVQVISCYDKIEENEISQTKQLGRVTDVIPKLIPNLPENDFYICGNPFMVKATEDLIRSLGVETIYMEKFGIVK
jgi:all-trans-retinol 13,14-reductase